MNQAFLSFRRSVFGLSRILHQCVITPRYQCFSKKDNSFKAPATTNTEHCYSSNLITSALCPIIEDCSSVFEM